MILYWIFILLALSKLLGGKLSYLADVPLRGVAHLAWLVPLQFGVILATRQAIPALAGLLIIATYFGLLWICALNRRLRGGKFILAGMALNFLVITANGGVMPITQPVLE